MGTDKTDRTARRILKPVIEKQRRDRINKRLDELRALLLSTTKDSRLRNPKLEKAEILELTVEFIRKKADAVHTQLTLTDSKDTSSSSGVLSGSKGVQSMPAAELTNATTNTCTRGGPDHSLPLGPTAHSLGPAVGLSGHNTKSMQTDSCTRGLGVQDSSSARGPISSQCSPPALADPRPGRPAVGELFAVPSNPSTLYAPPFSLHPFAAFAPPPPPLPLPVSQVSPSLHPFPSPPYSLSPPSSPCDSSPISSPPPVFSSSSSPTYFSISPPPLFSSSSSSSPPYQSIPHSSCHFIFPASLSPDLSSSTSSPVSSPGFMMMTPPNAHPNPAPTLPAVSMTTTPVQLRCALDRGQQPRRTLFLSSPASSPNPGLVWRPW